MRDLEFRPITVLALAILLSVPAIGDEVWYAGVASLPGSNSTHWHTEVVLHNVTSAPQDVHLDLRARGVGTGAATGIITLAPGEVRALPDLYAELGAAPGAGVLRVQGLVLSWVRTFNREAAGTFGQNVPPVRLPQTVEPGEKRLFSATATRNLATGFRSNLLLLNLAESVATFTVRGCGASTSLEIPGRTYDQLNNLGSWLNCPDGAFVAEVEATGAWNAYVSTIDPITGDPTTQSGRLATGETEPGNRDPVIAMLAVNPEQFLVGQKTKLFGVFYDPDHERVSWSVRIMPTSTASGSIDGPTSGMDALVSGVWAHSTGHMRIEVKVTDGRGGVKIGYVDAVAATHVP